MTVILEHSYERELAKELAYRFEDRAYSVADEYGEHAYTSRRVELLVYPLIKRTNCGIWIWLDYSLYPNRPLVYNPEKNYHTCFKRFVNLQANKRYALPTIEEALDSYIARKNREVAIYQARAKAAEAYKEAGLAFYKTKVIGHTMSDVSFT